MSDALGHCRTRESYTHPAYYSNGVLSHASPTKPLALQWPWRMLNAGWRSWEIMQTQTLSSCWWEIRVIFATLGRCKQTMHRSGAPSWLTLSGLLCPVHPKSRSSEVCLWLIGHMRARSEFYAGWIWLPFALLSEAARNASFIEAITWQGSVQTCLALQAFCEKESLSFIETSALESTNVEEAFKKILTEIYHIVSKKSLASEESGNPGPKSDGRVVVVPEDKNEEKKKSSCCSWRDFVAAVIIRTYVLWYAVPVHGFFYELHLHHGKATLSWQYQGNSHVVWGL